MSPSTTDPHHDAWEAYMDTERAQLQDRASGRMERALGLPVEGETEEDLARIADDDRRMAQQGLVRLMREGGEVYYLHIDQLTHENRPDRLRAEKSTVAWLKERLERRS